jgi:hypothetical protein
MLKLALNIQFVSTPMRTLLLALMMTFATQVSSEEHFDVRKADKAYLCRNEFHQSYEAFDTDQVDSVGSFGYSRELVFDFMLIKNFWENSLRITDFDTSGTGLWNRHGDLSGNCKDADAYSYSDAKPQAFRTHSTLLDGGYTQSCTFADDRGVTSYMLNFQYKKFFISQTDTFVDRGLPSTFPLLRFKNALYYGSCSEITKEKTQLKIASYLGSSEYCAAYGVDYRFLAKEIINGIRGNIKLEKGITENEFEEALNKGNYGQIYSPFDERYVDILIESADPYESCKLAHIEVIKISKLK